MRYRLDGFEIDLSTRTISGRDGAIHVEPQVYDVMVYLLEHRDRAVSKIELMEAIWGDQFISESALTSRIKSARAALDDSGRDQRVIRTVHGFGYQFVAAAQPLGASAAQVGEARSPRASLPRFADPLRGRSAELGEIAALVDRHQLVTLVGTGGTGKTRLAVEVVGATDEPERPAVFVDLAATRDADALPLAIASALGIETGDRPDLLAAVGEYLSALPHTLIIDNCEHVLAAAASAVAELLPTSEHSRILATSREPLGVAGERLYRLGPLDTMSPAAAAADVTALEQSPAAQLFVDRAHLADDGWQLDASTAQRIAELCRALDGLPLAIELAAGRVSTFGLDDLVGVLDRRLDVLGDRSSVREHRHRTLRATVEWSYDLLEESERRLFRALSVLPGGVSLDAVEWLSTRLELDVDGLAALARLVDASLLTRTTGPAGSRYVQLETLRAFGLDQLDDHDEASVVRHAAADSVVVALERIHDGMNTADEVRWTNRLRAEMANVRFARQYFDTADDIDQLVTINRLLTGWARLRDATEVWSWSDDLVDRLPADDPRAATALAMQAQATWRRGNFVAAQQIALRALDAASDDWTVSQAKWELGAALLFAGDLPGATAAWVDADRIDRDGLALGAAAVATGYTGDLAAAHQLLDRSESATTTPQSAAAWLNYCRAEVDNVAGEMNTEALERAIASARTLDAPFIEGVATVTLASQYTAMGDTQQAAAKYSDLIGLWLRSGSWTQLWTTLRQASELLAERHPHTALAILRTADADHTSSAALDADSAARIGELTARLEAAVDESVEPLPRLTVAEQTRSALADLVG